ncbi:BON domain-containing protein [Sorangium sp. So ce1151]|uniref:BON domain-containing protein n=1 Tax=Sorangium sp. So ce1151 TaxID=3133332 RepID=UPI003F5DB7BE
MREDICDHISEHPDLDASDVEVKVQNGEVVLSGTVRERRFKHQLESLAERISGVTDVRNDIRMYREQQQQGEAKTGAGLSSGERSTASGSTGGLSGSTAGTAGTATSAGATSSSETKNNESRRNAS